MPDANFEFLDGWFSSCVAVTADLNRLHTGSRWAEGPAWFAAHRTLVWSDIPNNRMLRWDEPTGAVGVFREPSGFSNGNFVGRDGLLLTCEHGNRRVTRTRKDGSLEVVADRWQGRRLNSPNDVVMRSDGSVWFTDPSYGIDSDYEGDRAGSEIGGRHVYRVDPAGNCEVVAEDFVRPNGLAFSPDERTLYVVDSGWTSCPDGPRHIRSSQVSGTGVLSGGAVFATCGSGMFDGLRLDELGRIWTSAGDGVH